MHAVLHVARKLLPVTRKSLQSKCSRNCLLRRRCITGRVSGVFTTACVVVVVVVLVVVLVVAARKQRRRKR